MKPQSWSWIFVVTGVAIRCVAINQPLVDAHLIRQCQTAAATKSLIEEGGFHLSSKIPWLADLNAHYVQELPLYNYLTIAAVHLTHDVDLSSKLVSILLWAGSFLCLQFIWRRVLTEHETLWANLLFVVAPMSIFYGQAAMPEMLVQLLAFAFLLLIARYDESPTLGNWMFCASVGAAGLLVKLPEVAHLYLVLAFILIRKEHWRVLIRPRYWIAAVLTIVLLKTWSSYVDSVNGAFLPEWTSMRNLRSFIGPIAIRFDIKSWATVVAYVTTFIFAGPSMLGAAYGLWLAVRKKRQGLLCLWLLSLVAFYLVWLGNGPATQSYYNLPSLAPLCALFGIGASALLSFVRIASWRRAATIFAGLVVIVPAIPIGRYLFKQDRQVLAAALWTKANTQPQDVILFRPNHRWDFVDYPYNPVLSYYSDRPTFVWTRNTPELYRRKALEEARYAVVTLPQPPPNGLMGYITKARASNRQPESTEWLLNSGFRLVVNDPRFQVYQRQTQ